MLKDRCACLCMSAPFKLATCLLRDHIANIACAKVTRKKQSSCDQVRAVLLVVNDKREQAIGEVGEFKCNDR